MKAGWYRDRDDVSVARYWDGTAWTGQTRPIAPPQTEPAPPAPEDLLDDTPPAAGVVFEAVGPSPSSKRAPEERVVATGRVSTASAVIPAAVTVTICLLVLVPLGFIGLGFMPVLIIMLTNVLPISGIMLLVGFTRKKYFTMTLTNIKISTQSGVLKRRHEQIFLKKVEAVGVEQSLFGRIFGYGSIVIIGTGGTRNAFKGMPNPQEFRAACQRMIDALPM